jgi:hypothetical protein
MERSSRELDKFVNEIPHEIIIPLTIPRSKVLRSLLFPLMIWVRYLWDGDRNCYLAGLKLKYLNSGGGEANTTGGDSQSTSERPSFAVLPSTTSLSLMASSSNPGGQVVNTPSTLTLSTIATDLPSSISGLNLTGADQTSFENNALTKQRRPSLARFPPNSGVISDDPSSIECQLQHPPLF